jgi:protein-tyrosine phosphatase
MSKLIRFGLYAALFSAALAVPARATDNIEVTRIDDQTVSVRWQDNDPVDIFLSATPTAKVSGTPLSAKDRSGEAKIKSAVEQRLYVVIRDRGDQSLSVAAERLLPLQQGSNFRDLGGYTGAGGEKIRWGRIYRSGALPLLSDQDNRLLGSLGIGTIVDLRSLEEREVAPTQLDDSTGALFVSNDYSIKPMFRNWAAMPQGNMYADFGTRFAPQYRSIFRRLLADDGAVLYHCSAGQDRTGVASALILSALGVDRKVILADYHKSTEWRRPQWELPALNPAEHPDNPIVQYYAAAAKKPGGAKADPLYTKDGQSHLAQFFAFIDTEYGGVEPFLQKELGIGPADIASLRKLYLSEKAVG